MRAPLAFLVAMAAGVALAQGINLQPSTTAGQRLELTDCPAQAGDGGAQHAGRLAEGKYLFRVMGEDTSVCFHSPASDGGHADGCLDGGLCWKCATDGEKFPQGTVMVWSVQRGGSGYSCRSLADGGDVVWTRVQ